MLFCAYFAVPSSDLSISSPYEVSDFSFSWLVEAYLSCCTHGFKKDLLQKGQLEAS